MIKSFKDIEKKLAAYDAKREELIKQARDVLKAAKLIIYSIHREDLKEAASLVAAAQKAKQKMDAIASFDTRLLVEGAFSDACQEYAEAICFYEYVKNESLPSCTDLSVHYEDYLMGVCDLTGEIGRRAVFLAGQNKKKEVEKLHRFVDDIYGLFLNFNLPNGLLRKKFDAVKWNLKKIEEVLYDLSKK